MRSISIIGAAAAAIGAAISGGGGGFTGLQAAPSRQHRIRPVSHRMYAPGKVLRAMRSRYMPHQGAKEAAKEYVETVGRNGHITISRI